MAHKRWLVIGFVYGLLLEFWSFCALGIGHGTALPLFISFAPVSLIGFVGSIESLDSTRPGWLTVVLLLAPALMWALAASLLVRAISYHRSKLAFLSFMTAHYLAVGFVIFHFREGLGGTSEPVWIMAWLLTYLFGQVAIWGIFMNQSRVDNRNAER
jgi:hypothetical protein